MDGDTVDYPFLHEVWDMVFAFFWCPIGDTGEDYGFASMLAGLFWSSSAPCDMKMYPPLFDVGSLERT